MWIQSHEPARVAPDRKWFGNVRTIDQQQLEKFRTEMAARKDDPRSVLIKAKKLPISLLVEQAKRKKTEVGLLELETYEDTFGPKNRRKRVKVAAESIEELAGEAQLKGEDLQTPLPGIVTDLPKEAADPRLRAGQSKRIWEELYKVLDASDVICVVLDARDPMGTRVYHVEQHLKKNCPQKHLVMILNKCDLIPTWLTSRWVAYLSKEFPTLAFKASMKRPFGRGPLINLLRQFDKFHRDKQTISVGLIGYPNVGKSSVINAVKASKVCKAAPIPGETRVWQYVALTKRIYMIDCPGIVYSQEGKDDVGVVLKGCIRAEKLADPAYYIPHLLQKAKKEDLKKIYNITDWEVETEEEPEDQFLKLIAFKKGKLIKGGEPDTKTVAKMVLMDWQRGLIPFCNYPPDYVQKPEEEQDVAEEEIEKQIIEQNNIRLKEFNLEK